VVVESVTITGRRRSPIDQVREVVVAPEATEPILALFFSKRP
jgi:hypothetical protein